MRPLTAGRSAFFIIRSWTTSSWAHGAGAAARTPLAAGELGDRAGVGRTVISEIELGRASEHRLSTLRAVIGALRGRLDVSIRGVDARAERLLDEAPAAARRAAR